jgi:hypothetical protein
MAKLPIHVSILVMLLEKGVKITLFANQQDWQSHSGVQKEKSGI